MEMARTEDDDLYRIFQSDYNEEMMMGDWFTLKVINHMVAKEEVIFEDGGQLFPLWDIQREDDPDKVVLDAVFYPMVTRQSAGPGS